MTETFTGSTTFTHNIPNATFPEKSGAATDKGSDDEGVLTDTPVGLNKDQLKLFAMQNNTNYTATTTVDHTYNEIQLPDGTKFTVTTHQTQTVTQKVTPIYSTFGNTQVITDVTVETTATDPQ